MGYCRLALYTACCLGLQDVVIETDIVKLWVSQDGRLNEELNFLSTVQQEATRVSRFRGDLLIWGPIPALLIGGG